MCKDNKQTDALPLERDKKKKAEIPPLRKNLSSMLTMQTGAVLLTVILIGGALSAMYNTKVDSNNIFVILSMLIPLFLLISFINVGVSRYMYKYLNALSSAMTKVADGDFSVRLDTEKKQPFREVYRDFNTMAEELGGVEMLKNDFINIYSHELRTPVTAINGFAEMLLKDDGSVSKEEARSYLEIIASESRRLADLIGNSLLMSKLDSQKIIPDKKTYSLDEQLRRCSILLSSQWQEKELDMTMDLEEASYTGAPDLMQHLWLNLMTNAIKYTPKNGSITITLKKDANFFVVTVADTGKGIAPEERERIFDRYYQTDKSHTNRGLGLGLSICKRIVQLCNGSIAVESKVGEGSAFIVRLPMQ